MPIVINDAQISRISVTAGNEEHSVHTVCQDSEMWIPKWDMRTAVSGGGEPTFPDDYLYFGVWRTEPFFQPWVVMPPEEYTANKQLTGRPEDAVLITKDDPLIIDIPGVCYGVAITVRLVKDGFDMDNVDRFVTMYGMWEDNHTECRSGSANEPDEGVVECTDRLFDMYGGYFGQRMSRVFAEPAQDVESLMVYDVEIKRRKF